MTQDEKIALSNKIEHILRTNQKVQDKFFYFLQELLCVVEGEDYKLFPPGFYDEVFEPNSSFQVGLFDAFAEDIVELKNFFEKKRKEKANVETPK